MAGGSRHVKVSAAAETAKPLVRSLDAEARDGPGDHQLLDLLGALEDSRGPGLVVDAMKKSGVRGWRAADE
jgi:hypothetical protein